MTRVQLTPNFYSDQKTLEQRVETLERAINQLANVGGDLAGTLPDPTVASVGGTTAPLHVSGDLIASAAATRSGCLLCDGSAVSRTTFATLFAAIGTNWGAGDGSTTFNVPDLRGRGPIGAGTGSGLTARTLGTHGGEETHLLSTAEMPAHSHGPSGAALNFLGTTGTPGQAIGVGSPSASFPTQLFQQSATGSQGSGSAHNNLQPFAVVNWFIKT